MIQIRSGMYSWYVCNVEQAKRIGDFLQSRGMAYTTEQYQRESDYFNVTLLNLN